MILESFCSKVNVAEERIQYAPEVRSVRPLTGTFGYLRNPQVCRFH